ncbi:MAG: glycosyl hydrolase 108 family protein [Phenylobacterium sp.]|nr:glycosyl hydrolase 108 family protein [Phenylobacterium sp.]
MNPTQPYKVPRPQGWTDANEARYAHVVRIVGEIEGGHSNDPVDRGGETHLGISLRFLKAVGGLDLNRDGMADLDLNLDTVLDGQDIRLLTPAIRYEVFLHHFYILPGFWTLAPPFDGAMFDQAVNGGTTAAIKILQRAMNRLPSIAPKLVVDGQFGPKSRAAFAKAVKGWRSTLMSHVRTEAELRYLAIIRADPSQAKYRNGWLRRARELGRA